MHHDSALIGVPTTRTLSPADLAAFGFLARYSGNTRARYRRILRFAAFVGP